MLQQRQEVYAPCSERDCGQAPCGSGPPGNGPRPSLHRGRSEVRTGEDRSEGLTADPGPKLRPSTPRSPTLADTAKKRPHEAFADGWRHKRNVHGALFSLKQEWSPPKLQAERPCGPAIPPLPVLQGIESRVSGDKGTPTSIAALFPVTNRWQQTTNKRPWTGAWRSQMGSIHARMVTQPGRGRVF